MEPEDILFTDGSDNTPGLAVQEVMYIPVEDIESMPCKCDDDSPGSFDELGTVSGDIVLKANKGFKRLYFTDETGELADELVGETDGMAVKNSLMIFHPGEKASILGFTAWAKNKKGFVFIAKDKDCHQRLFGNTCIPAKMKVSKGGTKAKSGDRKGREMTFEYVASTPAPYFTGRVDLTGGTIYSTGGANDFQTLFVN
jgi:hypothetical protein